MSYHSIISTTSVVALFACGLLAKGANAAKMPVASGEADKMRLEVSIRGHHQPDFSVAGSQRSTPAQLLDESAAEPALVFLGGKRRTRLHSEAVPCLLLCLVLCCSCCCFSGAGGPPGLICGMLVPLAIFLYVALGTTILANIADGQQVGFWCFVLGIWAIINLLCGACMVSLMCCGILGAGGISAWAYSKVMGEKPPWAEKEDLQQGLSIAGIHVQGFAAPPPAVATDAK
mmetsp:Transcript_118854/g.236803  ORF Transcript_118854/g.236803 Transcript_118854/m.236803 type:complete len:231 (+) Transcript_118854:31-723(+)